VHQLRHNRPHFNLSDFSVLFSEQIPSASSLGISWDALKSFCLQHKDQLSGRSTKAVRDEFIVPATALSKGAYSDIYPGMFGKANVFVSHAWLNNFMEDFVAALEAWVNSQDQIPPGGWFIWIDIFVVNQHHQPDATDFAAEARNFEIFSKAFEKVLTGIPQALIVMSPWNRPAWMFRIWCLYEFYLMLKNKIPHEFVMPPEQHENFIRSLGTEDCDFLDIASKLDMQNAEAYNSFDTEQIKQLVVKHLGGFSQVNENTIRAIREFCITTSISALRDMEQDQKANTKLLFNTANLLQIVGNLEKALIFYEEDLEIKIRCFGNSHVSVANTHVNMGSVCGQQGDYKKALFHFNTALPILILQLGNAHVSVASTQNNMAVVLEKQGKLAEALELYQKSLETTIRAVGPDHVSVAATYGNIGNVLEKQGKLAEALEMHQKCLEIEINSLGNSHVSVAATYGNIGNVLEKQGKLAEALEMHQKCLEIEINCLGHSHVSVAATYGNIGDVLKAQGKLAEALEMHQKCLEIEIECLGNSHVSVAGTEKNIGNVLFQKGDYENALLRYQKALQIEEVALGPSHVSVAMTKENIGIVLKRLGKIDEAKVMYREAHDLFLQSFGPEHFNTKKAARGLAGF
jgi:tetratricopeptide (TPR) repeat protein